MSRFVAILAVITWTGLVSGAGNMAARADSEGSKSANERHHQRADRLRERAQARTRSRLGHAPAFGSVTTVDPDYYYALTLQIKRLAGMVQTLRHAEARRARSGDGFQPGVPNALGLGSPTSAAVAKANIQAIYGPEGPTEKSVRLLLEYRLLVAGNLRLRVGKITDEDAIVTAQVVTAEGPLVEEFAVDKKTGIWKPVR
jgi:hypothetical protein